MFLLGFQVAQAFWKVNFAVWMGISGPSDESSRKAGNIDMVVLWRCQYTYHIANTLDMDMRSITIKDEDQVEWRL
jgi:hypothetical protein